MQSIGCGASDVAGAMATITVMRFDSSLASGVFGGTLLNEEGTESIEVTGDFTLETISD